MKQLCIFILFFASIRQAAFSQNTLTGVVKDKADASPLPGSIIYITDLKRNSITGVDGTYKFENLPSGDFRVEVHYVGYETKTVPVHIAGDTRLDVELTATHIEAGEVVITGVSHSTEVKRSPVPTVIVDKNQLVENTAGNIIDALAKTPGISQVTTGSGISKPVIRGLGANRIITLFDGIRQEGQQWGDEHGVEVDEFSIDRVEILKGPASLMYGSDGIGGVVNLLPPQPLPEGEVKGAITGLYQTNNHLFGQSVTLAGNKNGFSGRTIFSHKSAGNFRNPYDGYVFNSGFEEFNVTQFVGLDRKWGYSRFAVTAFDQFLGIPEGERDSAGRFLEPVRLTDSTFHIVPATGQDLRHKSISFPYQHVQHLRLYSNNSFVLGRNRLAVSVGYQNNRRREFEDILNPGTPGLYLFLQTLTYDLKYIFTERKGWETTLGINGMYQANKNKGIEFLIPDYNLLDAGLFVFTKKTIHKFDLSGGLRIDQRNLNGKSLYLYHGVKVLPNDTTEKRFTAFSRTFRSISGSVGATWMPTDRLLFKANVARGFRAPDIAELASNGVHEGTLRYERGNNLLNPETSLQEDLGFAYNSAHVSLELQGFYNSISNYIYLQKLRSSSGGDSIDTDLPVYSFIQGKAALYGGEASLDIHPHPLDWLHFENSVSLVYARNLSHTADSNKYLPMIPAPRTRTELRATNNKQYHRLRNSYAMIELEHFFAQDRVLLEAGTERPSSAYTLINAGLGSEVLSKAGKTLFNISITGSNLANVAYQNNLSRLRYAPENPLTHRPGIYNMGRNIGFRIVVPF